ncbi:MAG: MFS transporter [Gulosibacter sp.]|uniref:MFS transporter n=1 Tax=Gulosibacter sp. TaxID=2817531 RepID=UPI003F909723
MTKSLIPPKRFSIRETRSATVIAFFAWTIAVFDFILFGTLLPVIKEDLGWSDSQALLIATLTTLGGAIVVLIIGPIVDRFGRRKGMMITVGGTALSSALTAVSVNTAMMVGVRSLSGLGLSEQTVNATYLNEVYELSDDEKVRRRRGFFYGIVQSGWPVGALLASGFVAVIGLAIGHGQWQWMFLLATIPGLIVLIIRRTLRESPQFLAMREVKKLRADSRNADADVLVDAYNLRAADRSPVTAIFTGPRLRNTVVLSLAFAGNWFGVQCFSVLGSTVLTDTKGLDFALVAPLLVIVNLVAAAGYVFFGWMGDKVNRRNLIGAGWIIGGALFAVMLLTDMPVWLTVVVYALGLFCLLGPASALFLYIAECYDPSCRATGGTFVLAVSQPGAVIAGFILTALIAGGMASAMAFTLVGALGCALGGLLIFAAKKVDSNVHLAPYEVPAVGKVQA